ncbi:MULTISPECIES: DUF397 domain-containing protein [unclassified Streptomyces]|uniref:DUF397 domain-containing protein n=1 Tax=unclassified Streptomyces TaxID=2593676 RepID=UPI003639D695
MRSYSNGVSAASIDAAWVKSKKSSANGQCVELASLPHGRVAMRNSTDPSGPALVFTREELDAFLDGAKNQEFDHLIGR